MQSQMQAVAVAPCIQTSTLVAKQHNARQLSLAMQVVAAKLKHAAQVHTTLQVCAGRNLWAGIERHSCHSHNTTGVCCRCHDAWICSCSVISAVRIMLASTVGDMENDQCNAGHPSEGSSDVIRTGSPTVSMYKRHHVQRMKAANAQLHEEQQRKRTSQRSSGHKRAVKESHVDLAAVIKGVDSSAMSCIEVQQAHVQMTCKVADTNFLSQRSVLQAASTCTGPLRAAGFCQAHSCQTQSSHPHFHAQLADSASRTQAM